MPVRATFTATTAGELEGWVTGLALASLSQMRDPATGHRIPPLYTASGIRYTRELRGNERWQSALESAALRCADCEDLAGYRVAELWRHGEMLARPRVLTITPTLRHVVVVRADGTIEDPSELLGMKGHG